MDSSSQEGRESAGDGSLDAVKGRQHTERSLRRRGRTGDSTSLDYVYRRTGGGSGFAGKWVSSSEQVNSVVVLKVRTWESDGLSFISQGGGGTKNVKFDGKDYANVGAVVDGLTASARRVNERTVEITDKISGKVKDTQEISVSADGKTLTMTVHIPGRSEPNVRSLRGSRDRGGGRRSIPLQG